jgi:hypothetical protein
MSVIVEIFIAPAAGADLQPVREARALVGKGLEGDRYALGVGSFSRWPGLRAEVLEEGVVRVGDAIEVLPLS